MCKPVLTKKDMVRRYRMNEFGNHSPTWETCAEFVQHRHVDPEQLCHLRNRTAGGPTYYNVRYCDIPTLWHKQANMGNWYCSFMCPHEYNLIQGEVQQGIFGLDLHYSLIVGKPMREALAEDARNAFGLRAKGIMEFFLKNPNDLEWLYELLRKFPDHVVEFTTLSIQWGTLPGYSTLFWEVRSF
jgi:hypothetical protein